MTATANDEKLKNIRRIVNELAEKQAKELVFNAKKAQEEELKCQEEMLSGRSVLELRELEAQVCKTKMREVLEQQAKSKKSLMQQRDEIETQVFKVVLQRINAYVGSPEYMPTEAKKLKALKAKFGVAGTVVYSKEQDVSGFKAAAEEAWGRDVEVVAAKNICLGGFILVNQSKGIALDMSLDSAVEKERKTFFSFAELEII